MNEVTQFNKNQPLTLERCYIDPKKKIFTMFNNSKALNVRFPEGWVIKKFFIDMPSNPHFDWDLLLNKSEIR